MSEEASRAGEAARAPSLAVAVVGHHRSGKTSLVAALTRIASELAGFDARAMRGEDLDRLGGSPPYVLRGDRLGSLHFPRARHGVSSPNKAPGPDLAPEHLTIAGAKVLVGAPGRRITVVDCPGRRPWLKNVARGLAIADAALVVISAPDSVQEQTREHLHLARALGIRQVVAFLNRCDLVADLEWLDLVERDVREALDAAGFDGDEARVLRGAAGPASEGPGPWDPSVRDLLGVIEGEVEIPARAPGGLPLLYLDRRYGRRPSDRLLVEGRVRRGTIAVGDTLWIPELGDAVRIADLEQNHRKTGRALAGDQVGLLIYRPDRPLRSHEVASGLALVGDERGEAPAQVGWLTVDLELLGVDDNGRRTPIREGHELLCIFGTTLASGWVRLGGGPAIAAGERARARIQLRAPIYVEAGMTFALRDGNQGPWGGRERGAARWAGLCGRGTVVSVGPPTPA